MQALRILLSALASWSKDVPRARMKIALAMLLGLAAGLGSTILLGVINAVLLNGPSVHSLIIFALTCIIAPLSGFAAQALLIRLTSHATRDLRLRLSKQILATPYLRMEQLGFSKITAIMTEDVPVIITAMVNIPILFTQAAVVAGSLAYLGWLSWPLLLMLLVYMVLGILTYRLPLKLAMQSYGKVREYWDSFFSGVHALSFGNKELKLHRGRRLAFLAEQFQPAIDGLQVHTARAATFTAVATNWGQILFFVFIGLAIFAVPLALHVSRQALSGYTITVLFMITPLTIILNLLSSYGQASIALTKVNDLGLSLAAPTQDAQPSPTKVGGWNSIELQDVVHSYNREAKDEPFKLGPVNLTLYPGEIVFLVGGNGSGKTTLAKLLIGLYDADEGKILFDGVPLESSNLDAYRQLFSVVFADFFLFERLYGLDENLVLSRGAAYLELLQLSQKVQLKGGQLSTLDLSQGQRKRLALLTAYLEDRPIYVFDEWASDQDPWFKTFFYRTILPGLQARGRAIVVISHDDRYYDVADRIIKLEDGRIQSDSRSAVHLLERSDLATLTQGSN